MIVRDAGAAWHVVLQPEHAELSEEVARAWADRGPRHDSVVLAARRHDDGWATWERSPMVDADGKPVTFLDVHVPAHLAFYRAVIAAVTDEDAYAGLLVSMHGAGIYRQRYGADPALALTRAPEVQALVDAFVAEQESGFPARMDEVGVDDELRLADYHRLQWFDRFSLAFCLREWDTPGEPFEVGSFRFEPVGPWRSRVLPWPFAEPDARVLARPPPRPEAGVAAGGVPRGVLRPPGGARHDRARRVTDDERLTWLRVPSEDELPPEVLELWQPSLEKLGFVPNVLRLYALRPDQPARLERVVRRGDEGRVRPDEGRAGDDRRGRLGRERLRVLHGRPRRRAAQADEGSRARRRHRGRPHERSGGAARPGDARLRRKLTLRPTEMTEADVVALRDVGWSDEDVMDVAEVTGLFNMSNRMASGLGWAPNPEYDALGR